jgi:hypothetical protein
MKCRYRKSVPSLLHGTSESAEHQDGHEDEETRTTQEPSVTKHE